MSADLARAVFAFLALPGVIAFALPLWLARGQAFQPIGLVALVPGLVGLFWCVRDFYVKGKGTLAPWSPPKELVVVGLYRWSRNPMYVSVLLVLVGWALGFGARTLWMYAAIVAVGFHLRVLLNEEPFLARTHGAAWETYRSRVRRWL